MSDTTLQRRVRDAVISRVAAKSRQADKVLSMFALREQGMSTREMARRLDISPATITKWVSWAKDVEDVGESLGTEVLTEDYIARARARIAVEALEDGDHKTALEAMRDEAKRQRIDVETTRVEQVQLVVALSNTPRVDRIVEMQQRMLQLGIAPPEELSVADGAEMVKQTRGTLPPSGTYPLDSQTPRQPETVSPSTTPDALDPLTDHYEKPRPPDRALPHDFEQYRRDAQTTPDNSTSLSPGGVSRPKETEAQGPVNSQVPANSESEG